MKKEVVLGKVIQRELSRKGISQIALSSKCSMRNTTLHSYLYGALPKGLTGLINIADFFDLSLDELVFGKPEGDHKKVLRGFIGRYAITLSEED